MAQATNIRHSVLFWDSIADPEVHTWPLMKNSNLVLGIVSIYTFLVLFLIPYLMKNRKPFVLKNTILAYNAAHVIISIILVYKALATGLPFADYFSTICYHKVFRDPQQDKVVAAVVWWYALAKIVELPDTIFFALRKKYNQVTFLHVYHHGSTLLFAWFITKIGPEENTVFIVAINSFIHILMYTYYALSALGPQYRKYLWWKKYMTMFQIIQFFCIISYTTLGALSNCKMGAVCRNLIIGNTLGMVFLFSRFYSKEYAKGKKDKEMK